MGDPKYAALSRHFLVTKPRDYVALLYHAAVESDTAVRGISVRPTSNRARNLMGRPIRPFGRMVRGGGMGRDLVDQPTPLADGPRPASLGVPFIKIRVMRTAA